MNSAEELIDRLVEVGARVEAADGRLIVRAGARPVPRELVRRLREAKVEVLATLSPAWWHRQFVVRTIDRELRGARSRDDAARLAWGELECRWHRLFGAHMPEGQCAGCGEPIGGRAALSMGEGNRAHLDDAHGLECVIAYGKRWRGVATAALQAMGLVPPDGPLLRHGRRHDQKGPVSGVG